ncbi:MAG: acyltransferase family protein [Prevotella sp.]|nr:acyltransferase family protein [Prevotella sp.]
MDRNLSIDLVKVIAMFMVMALHVFLCHIVQQSLVFSWNYGIASIAIPLFFMVSGFLLCRKDGQISYSVRKIKGILKFVFITITFIVLLNIILPPHVSLVDGLKSYYAWFYQKGLVWQYWYFGAMIILYALLPLLLKIIHSRWLPYVILALVAIGFVMFLLNIFYEFEKHYIRQTFRLWYWLMYFFVGAYIRLHQQYFSKIGWWHVLGVVVFMLVYVYYVEIPYDEYAFGSIICMIYAVTVFSACLNTKIKHGKVIQELSRFFLPVYAMHPFVISRLEPLSPYFQFTPAVQYFVVLIIIFIVNIALAFVLMRIPYVKDIFKI